MNNIDIETQLSANGFTKKDITILRRYLERDGSSYITLLCELRKRFIVSSIIAAILLLGWVYTLIFEDPLSNITYSIMLAIVLPLLYIFSPIKLGYKSMRIKIKF